VKRASTGNGDRDKAGSRNTSSATQGVRIVPS
jgi:hypothetical protein